MGNENTTHLHRFSSFSQKLKCNLHVEPQHQAPQRSGVYPFGPRVSCPIQYPLVHQRQHTIVTTAFVLTGGNAAKRMVDVMQFPVRISVGLALGTSTPHLGNGRCDESLHTSQLQSVSDDGSVSRRHFELVDELEVKVLSSPGR